MVFASWDERLDAAANNGEVMDVARDFVASLDTFEIAVLPAVCRPPKLRASSEISAYAFDLLAYECSAEDPPYKIINKLAIFFAQAASRLAQIHAPVRRIDDNELGLTRKRK